MNSEQLIAGLLLQDEGPQLEFKKTADKETIGRVICSFLNGEGGQLIVGVDDDKVIIGVNDPGKLQAEMSSFLTEQIIPESPVMVSVETFQGKELLMFKVWAGSRQPYIFDGGIYFRRGSQTVRATSMEISELIHNRQGMDTHWERQLASGVDLEDLDLEQLAITIKETNNKEKTELFMGDPIAFLTHFGLYQNDCFTNAAVVLFAKNPTRFIPQARVRIALLENGKTGDQFVDDHILDGNLFATIDRVQDFLAKHLSKSRRFSQNNWKHNDDFIFPMSALREGVINALVHRDYLSISSSATIIIYPDRLEITNSGNSPLKASQLKKSHLSMPVNPDIAHMTFLRGYMEKIGRGTLKILEACQIAGLKEPVWETEDNSVKLIFFSKGGNEVANVGNNDGTVEGTVEGENDGTIEGAIKGTIEGAIKGITTTVKIKLSTLLSAIAKQEGKRVPEYEALTTFNTSALERYLKILRDAELIEFRGSSLQTGGYYLTQSMKEKLQQK